jgi:ATP-dependent Lon protease
MTAFGNAKLARRDRIEPCDLPEAGFKKSSIGFVQ